MDKIKIKQVFGGEEHGFNLSINGQEINGITSLTYHANVGEVPILKLEILTRDIHMELDGIEIECNPMNDKFNKMLGGIK